jgi:hypothetical protein
MTSIKIKPTPSLKTQKAICHQTKGTLGHSNEPRPKNLSKTPIRVESKTMNEL